MRGSRVAVQGRSRLGTRLVTQLTVGDGDENNDGGIVRHKLPTKKGKKAKPHCLNDAIVANRRSVKKK